MKSQNPYLKNRRQITLEQREPAQTKQSFKDECNIHNIIKQYNKTGLVEHINEKTPQDVDHTQIPDFQDSLNFVTEAKQNFNQLPKNIQKRFNYDINEMSEFLSNPDNYNEAEKLGLITRNPNNTKPDEEGPPPQPIKRRGEPSLDSNSNPTNQSDKQ